MAGEEFVIVYAAGCLTPFIMQRVVLPWVKRYWGIKYEKPKKAKKNDDPPRVASKGKIYEIHVHLPKEKDEEESK